jgi:hypothetical protein
LTATQSWVCPQQVTVPDALLHVPVATVQVRIDPPEQVAVQVWVAETSVVPPQVAIITTANSPANTKTLRILLSLHSRFIFDSRLHT